MTPCQMCGERCVDPPSLEAHLERHRGPERLPVLPAAQAFERAFDRQPIDDELDRFIAG